MLPVQVAPTPLDVTVFRLVLAAALGMFLGLEREWSHKSAGIRTYALFSLLGAVFTIVGSEALVVVVIGGIASSTFGSTGFVLTSALTGLVSSTGATTSAVLLYRGGGIGQQTAMLSILAATAVSILVKAALTASSANRQFATRVAMWSSVVLVGASLTAGVLLL